MGCIAYFSCTREHSFDTSYNEVNNNENNNKNNINANKNNKNKNENNEMIDENENNENDNDNYMNKNNDSKNQSSELEEKLQNEIMFKNFISCPKSIFAISFSLIAIFIFHLVDVCLIAFGVFKDENGEELYMWY